MQSGPPVPGWVICPTINGGPPGVSFDRRRTTCCLDFSAIFRLFPHTSGGITAWAGGIRQTSGRPPGRAFRRLLCIGPHPEGGAPVEMNFFVVRLCDRASYKEMASFLRFLIRALFPFSVWAGYRPARPRATKADVPAFTID